MTNNSSDKKESLLLIFLMAMTILFEPEYYSAIYLLFIIYYVFIYGFVLTKEDVGVIFPLLGVFLIGFFYAHDNAFIEIYKDVWYIFKIIGCFFVGLIVSRNMRDIKLFLNYFLYFGLVVSVVYLYKYYSSDLSGIDFTMKFGLIPLIAAACPALIYCKNSAIIGGDYKKLTILSIILLAFFFSYSRTAIFCVIILVFALNGGFDDKKKLLFWGFWVVVVTTGLTYIMPAYDPNDISFLGKMTNSFNEISFVDGSDEVEMISNWRGFEAFMANKKYIEADILRKLFGHGYGSSVDLGLFVEMGNGMTFRYLPILHNGYYHVLVKYGMVGLILYIYFIGRIFFRINFVHEDIMINRFLMGIGVVYLYTSLVITGLFNKNHLDAYVLLLGVFYGINKVGLIKR